MMIYVFTLYIVTVILIIINLLCKTTLAFHFLSIPFHLHHLAAFVQLIPFLLVHYVTEVNHVRKKCVICLLMNQLGWSINGSWWPLKLDVATMLWWSFFIFHCSSNKSSLRKLLSKLKSDFFFKSNCNILLFYFIYT